MADHQRISKIWARKNIVAATDPRYIQKTLVAITLLLMDRMEQNTDDAKRGDWIEIPLKEITERTKHIKTSIGHISAPKVSPLYVMGIARIASTPRKILAKEIHKEMLHAYVQFLSEKVPGLRDNANLRQGEEG